MLIKKGLNRQQTDHILLKREVEEGSVALEHIATVIAFFSHQASIVTHDGHQKQCHIRRNIPGIVVGDRVIYTEEGGSAVITGRVKRKNAFCVHHKRIYQGASARKPIYGKTSLFALDEAREQRGLTKDVAANVDQVMIVFSRVPTVQLMLLDRFLVNAWQNNISPVLIANKRDQDSPDQQVAIEQILDIYRSMLPCYYLSTQPESAYSSVAMDLLPQMHHKTTLLVGQSGMGKSSLLKLWQPDLTIPIGTLSDNGMGKHTTSVSRCFTLVSDRSGTQAQNRTFVIDCPGVRQLAILPMRESDLQRCFPDIDKLSGECSFMPCGHSDEQDCAVKRAVEDGTLAWSRLLSFLTIRQEMREQFY